MQPIDVPGDAAVQAIETMQLGQRHVRRARTRRTDAGIGNPPELPVLAPAADAVGGVPVGELAEVAVHRRSRFQTRSATLESHAFSAAATGAAGKKSIVAANTTAAAAPSATLTSNPSTAPHDAVRIVKSALLTT